MITFFWLMFFMGEQYAGILEDVLLPTICVMVLPAPEPIYLVQDIVPSVAAE